MTLTRRHLLGAAAAALGAHGAPTFAQSWPTGPVRLISPYGAGGSNDILTRLLGEFFAQKAGQSFVVENKAGAGTRIANEFVARAQPDGSTILHAAAPIAIGEALYPKLPYDVRKSFEAIVTTAIAPLFLVVNAQAPFKTVAELVQHGKASPNGLTFGSPGAASAPHLTAELLFRAAEVKGLNVHFRGDANAYNELLAGRIDATLTALATAVPHVQAGKLRVLAVATEERTSVHRQTPTFRELGLTQVVGYGWYGLLAPAGTPSATVQRINAVANAALGDAEVRRKAEAVGLQLRGGSSAEFAAFIDSEARKWSQVIRAANITGE
jgi:tripartite-type tricarboxylate transporter receptor subunit TctC